MRAQTRGALDDAQKDDSPSPQPVPSCQPGAREATRTSCRLTAARSYNHLVTASLGARADLTFESTHCVNIRCRETSRRQLASRRLQPRAMSGSPGPAHGPAPPRPRRTLLLGMAVMNMLVLGYVGIYLLELPFKASPSGVALPNFIPSPSVGESENSATNAELQRRMAVLEGSSTKGDGGELERRLAALETGMAGGVAGGEEAKSAPGAGGGAPRRGQMPPRGPASGRAARPAARKTFRT